MSDERNKAADKRRSPTACSTDFILYDGGMEAEKIYNLAEQNLAHHVDAFAATGRALHTTILFGVGACGALGSFVVASAKDSPGVSVVVLIVAIYIGSVTAFFARRQYRAFETPAMGREPKNFLDTPARNYTKDQFYVSELRNIQKRINTFQKLNGERGANLNHLVSMLMASPLIFLVFGLPMILLQMCS